MEVTFSFRDTILNLDMFIMLKSYFRKCYSPSQPLVLALVFRPK